MKLHPRFKGVSFSVAVGRWARPHVWAAQYTARVCLGFVAFTFYTLDLEDFVQYLIAEKKETDE